MDHRIYIGGASPALRYAESSLRQEGFPITQTPEDSSVVLLDIPSFDGKGRLRNGRDPELLFSAVPKDCLIIGGNLTHPAIESWNRVDLLQREHYLKQNAAITAYCALEIASGELTTILSESPTLLIGWGRIGKQLAKLLRGLSVPLTVAARSKSDRELLCALGYTAAGLEDLQLEQYRLIINTAPAPLLSRHQLDLEGHPVKLDLASVKGLEGEDVIWARGLPGIKAPESSGRLIAQSVGTILREEYP